MRVILNDDKTPPLNALWLPATQQVPVDRVTIYMPTGHYATYAMPALRLEAGHTSPEARASAQAIYTYFKTKGRTRL